MVEVGVGEEDEIDAADARGRGRGGLKARKPEGALADASADAQGEDRIDGDGDTGEITDHGGMTQPCQCRIDAADAVKEPGGRHAIGCAKMEDRLKQGARVAACRRANHPDGSFEPCAGVGRVGIRLGVHMLHRRPDGAPKASPNANRRVERLEAR